MAKVCRTNMENKGVCQELDGSDAHKPMTQNSVSFVCYVVIHLHDQYDQ
jgi:hypothetical protein